MRVGRYPSCALPEHERCRENNENSASSLSSEVRRHYVGFKHALLCRAFVCDDPAGKGSKLREATAFVAVAASQPLVLRTVIARSSLGRRKHMM